MGEFFVSFGKAETRSLWYDAESAVWCHYDVVHWPRLGDMDDLLEVPLDEEEFEHG